MSGTGISTTQAGLSELEIQNLGYVAASTTEIQEVLVQDTGLLVELKRYVAQEASNSGQLVDEADLTNEAIFERLNRDIRFRGVATRLLQRYGYLTPSPKPDSPLAKEQELMITDRARRRGQIEAQEDADFLERQKKARDLEEVSNCDSGKDENCPAQNARPVGKRSDAPAESPQIPLAPPGSPDQRPLHNDRAIQTSGIPMEMAGLDSGTLGIPSNRTPDSSLYGPTPEAMDRLGVIELPINSALVGTTQDQHAAAAMEATGDFQRPRQVGDLRGNFNGQEFSSVSLVHKLSPFADVPSLYDMYVQAQNWRQPERFGLDVFRHGSRAADVMPMDLPVGPDYVVGPGDGLSIDVWGGISQRLVRVVDREGRIDLPEVGPMLVSGRSLGEVQDAVQRTMRTEFRDVFADVSLSRLRTIRVYVVGEVTQPGAYDISSLSTPLNAIFEAGGITPRGSLRHMKQFRGKQLVQQVDAYDLLLRGMPSGLGRLENGDTLMVPPLDSQVTVDGMVRRPAIYELNGEKALADVVELAGGILPTATLNHVEVQRVEAHQKHTMLSLTVASTDSPDDILKQLKEFQIADGDEVHIFPIAPYNEDAIYLQGHVIRPGRYSYHKDMKLTDLVTSYKDLLPMPAEHYAEIIRLNPPDDRPSVESFDLAAALKNPAKDPVLEPLDTVRIFSKYDFEPAPAVWVGGEVRAPGKYNTSGEAHLRDAIFMAGGLAAGASLDSAQLYRTQADGKLKILSVNLKEALAGNPMDNILLQPRDHLLIHRNTAAVDPASVYVRGEVAKPGRYPLTTNMHVEDLLHVAGGLKRSAYTDSADLMRYPENAQGGIGSEHAEVNLAAASGGETNADLALRDGDVLTIKPIAGWSDIGAAVTLRGEIQHPGIYGIHPGERLSTALERAGGFTPEAYPYGAVLIRREVRELEATSHNELVARLNSERRQLQGLSESSPDEKNAKLTAIEQLDVTMKQLVSSEPIGRVVIHWQPDGKGWKGSSTDVPLRGGDVLVVPKKSNFVLVNGQVFNPTAINYRPGLSAKWYLSQAGGLTPLADKKGVFVIRADGSVIASKNNGAGWWEGDPMNSALRAGDMIVVPEKPQKIGGTNWVTALQAAQVAASVALAVAYIHP